MNIGAFTKKGDDLTGTISTFGASFENVTFEAITAKNNGPDYIIHTEAGELGAAWKKTSKQGNDYLSVSFRGPFLPGEVYAALLPTKAKGEFVLVWNELKKDEA